MKKPTPIDEEIKLDPKRYIVSETDAKGKITYANDYSWKYQDIHKRS